MLFPTYKQSLAIGIPLTIVSYLFFATSSAFVKIVNHDFPTAEIVLFQNIFSLICIIPYCMIRWKRPFQIRKNLGIHLTRDLAGFLSYFFYFYAIKTTNLIDATVLAYTTPFFTPLVWWLWMREKSSPKIWWTIILGFFGIALILKPTNGLFQVGALFGLISGMFSALSLVSIRVINNKMEALSKTLVLLFISGIVFSLPLAIPVWVTPNFSELTLLFGIGLLLAIGQVFLTFAYRFGTAAYLSPISYTMVIFMTIISWIFFDQKADIYSGLGALLIIVGGSLSYIIKVKPKTTAEIFQRPPHHKHKNWKSYLPFKHPPKDVKQPQSPHRSLED